MLEREGGSKNAATRPEEVQPRWLAPQGSGGEARWISSALARSWEKEWPVSVQGWESGNLGSTSGIARTPGQGPRLFI